MSDVIIDEELQPGGSVEPDDADSQDGNNGGDEELASFLDAYDLGEVEDPQAKATAEAFIKRVNAGYTRQRQQDTQAVREAKEAQEVFNLLLDPETAPGIIKALGYEVPGAQENEGELDEFDLRDPRVDALLAERDQERQVSAAQERVTAENAYVTEQIETLESRIQKEYADPKLEFSEEEIELLYLLADEHRDQNGAPDIEAAYRILDAAGANHRVRASKPKPRPPRRLGGGSAGEQQVDLSDPEKRKEVMLAAWRRAKASSE